MSSSWDHTQRIVYFECANIEVCSVQALIQQNNSIIITRGIYICLYSQQHVYRLTTSSLFPIKKSGSMHLSLEVLLTVGADEEVSLTETERIRLLADYIQETKRFDLDFIYYFLPYG
jgi:hypothetical protein